MVSQQELAAYQGVSFERGANHLYLPSHPLLQPHISHYTVSFPTANDMPDSYAILPSASCTLVVSVGSASMHSRLRGVNTQACIVGTHANKMKLLLLIEFRPGGLRPFLQIDQQELMDISVGMELLDRPLMLAVEHVLEQATDIGALIDGLDGVFLSRLAKRASNHAVTQILRYIQLRRGEAAIGELACQFHYSPRQIGRMFAYHVGAGPKEFSRIVRVNHAIRILQDKLSSVADVAAQAGYFDQPHFVHDFRSICGLTPQDYLKKMSVFYNERYKW